MGNKRWGKSLVLSLKMFQITYLQNKCITYCTHKYQEIELIKVKGVTARGQINVRTAVVEKY